MEALARNHTTAFLDSANPLSMVQYAICTAKFLLVLLVTMTLLLAATGCHAVTILRLVSCDEAL